MNDILDGVNNTSGSTSDRGLRPCPATGPREKNRRREVGPWPRPGYPALGPGARVGEVAAASTLGWLGGPQRLPGRRTWGRPGRGRPAPAKVRGMPQRLPGARYLCVRNAARGRPPESKFSPAEGRDPLPCPPPKAGGGRRGRGATWRPPRSRLPGTRSLEIGKGLRGPSPFGGTPGHPSKSRPQPKPSTGAREDVPNTHPSIPTLRWGP